MQSTRLTVISVCLLLLLIQGAAAAQQPSAPDTDNTVTRIEVHEYGSAEWTIRVRTRLETQADVSTFTAFQSEFRNNTSRYLEPFRERMTALVDASDGVTGRDMSVHGFSASTEVQEVPRRWGVVSYRFVWTNFTARGNGDLVVGDVFEGGFFISEGDRLQITAPPGYVVGSLDPEPLRIENGTATWEGRRDFSDGHPRVVLTPREASVPIPQFTAFIVLLVLGGIGYLVLRRHRGEPGSVTGDSDDLVSDEERVLELLAENGGRMKQADIVDSLDWSKAKTSRVISRMADEETISKLQLGRENVIEIQEDE